MGRCRSDAAAVPTTNTTMAPGIFGANFLKRISVSSATPASAVAAGLMVPIARPIAAPRPRKSPGTLSICNPRKSFTWVLAMRRAIPLVKPTTTGRGMNLTADPSPVAPRATSITPAIRVQTNRPLTPNFATMPATTTTKAPVGPLICACEPPRAEAMKPATIAV